MFKVRKVLIPAIPVVTATLTKPTPVAVIDGLVAMPLALVVTCALWLPCAKLAAPLGPLSMVSVIGQLATVSPNMSLAITVIGSGNSAPTLAV